jgi:hypothetical protein
VTEGNERPSTPRPADELPPGLRETIAAFAEGCDAKHKRVAPAVELGISARFRDTYEAEAGSWNTVKDQILPLARLAGRLAALYAEKEGRDTVDWTDARFGLRDVQEECQSPSGFRGKHCMGVNLGPP